MAEVLPLIAEEIADRDEADYPDNPARPCPYGEGAEVEFAHASSQCREVAQTGNEVAEEKSPRAIAAEPHICFGQMPAEVAVEQWRVR